MKKIFIIGFFSLCMNNVFAMMTIPVNFGSMLLSPMEDPIDFIFFLLFIHIGREIIDYSSYKLAKKNKFNQFGKLICQSLANRHAEFFDILGSKMIEYKKYLSQEMQKNGGITYKALGKIAFSRTNGKIDFNDDMLKKIKIAFHEAGHAIVCDEVPQELSLLRTDDSSGHVKPNFFYWGDFMQKCILNLGGAIGEWISHYFVQDDTSVLPKFYMESAMHGYGEVSGKRDSDKGQLMVVAQYENFFSPFQIKKESRGDFMNIPEEIKKKTCNITDNISLTAIPDSFINYVADITVDLFIKRQDMLFEIADLALKKEYLSNSDLQQIWKKYFEDKKLSTFKEIVKQYDKKRERINNELKEWIGKNNKLVSGKELSEFFRKESSNQSSKEQKKRDAKKQLGTF